VFQGEEGTRGREELNREEKSAMWGGKGEEEKSKER
jgi:hypothetical protein